MKVLKKITNFVSKYMAIIVIAIAALALFAPGTVSFIKTKYVNTLLGIVMFGMGLTLREGNREYFYKMLDRHFPRMKERYIKTFGNSYVADSPNSAELNALLRQFCTAHDILADNEQVFAYLSAFEEKKSGEQISLF